MIYRIQDGMMFTLVLPMMFKCHTKPKMLHSPMTWVSEISNSISNVEIPFARLFNQIKYLKSKIILTISYFTIQVNQLNRTIPLYVWNLVKKNDKKDTGVVVIGVNSPFFPGDKSKTVLCKDTCDKVTWLNPLKNTRKIASMGYIFCCDPKDVKKILNGFPQMW